MRAQRVRGSTLLVRWVDFVQQNAVAVLAISVFLAGIGVWAAATRMQFLTDRSDLLGPNHQAAKDHFRFCEEFDRESDLVVAIEGKDRSSIVEAIDWIAVKLRERPDLFEKVMDRIDTSRLRAKGLFQLSMSALAAIENHLAPMRPLLTGPAAFAPEFAWKNLTLERAIGEFSDAMAIDSPNKNPSNARVTTIGVVRTLESLANYLENPNAGYRSPWKSETDDLPSALSADTIPDYLFSPKGNLAIVRALPVRNSSSFVGLAKPVAELRKIAEEARSTHSKVSIGLTGIPILEDDEMQTAMTSSGHSVILQAIGILLVFSLGFRAFRHPLYVQLALTLAVCWTLGFVALAIGHLNILSMTFIVTLLGMGVGFGIVWLTQFEFARQLGEPTRQANRTTVRLVGSGLVASAVTTALAFVTTALTPFQGLREMGIIAAAGVIFCLVAMFTVLPALLSFGGSLRKQARSESADHQIAFSLFAGRPKLVLGISLVAFTLGMLLLPRLKGDFNLLNLQAKGLDSVQWEHRLIDEMGTSGWYATSEVSDATSAKLMRRAFESLPEVGRVIEIATLLPDDQIEKQPIIKRIESTLASLPIRLPEAQIAVANLHQQLVRLAGRLTNHSTTSALVQRVLAAMERIQPDDAQLRVTQFQQAWRRDLHTQLATLKASANSSLVTIDDLPASLVERYRGKTGQWMIQVFPKESCWDYKPLSQFVSAVKRVDPHATGKPITSLHGIDEMIGGLLFTGLLATAMIFLACWFDLKDFRLGMLAMAPLLIGGVIMAGVMVTFGLTFNPANLIALPLILGLGVDFGVHVLHDYKQGNDCYFLKWRLARALVLTTATTVIGFASLLISGHRGMASIGIVLTVGVLCCSVTALITLPAMLNLISNRRRDDEAGEILVIRQTPTSTLRQAA